jgi:2-methylcitrate synthase
LAGHFLTLLHGATPGAEHGRCMDVSLILYAEHEFNASTFTARVCAATLSDFSSCITGAIGTLRGRSMEVQTKPRWSWSQNSRRRSKRGRELKRCWREKVMGFGHAVYRSSDPRNAIIKEYAGAYLLSVSHLVPFGI